MLCVTVLCAQELSSTFGSELKGRESVWLRPRQAQQSFRYLSMGIEQLETSEAAEIFEAAGVIVGRDHRLSARWNTEAYTVAHQWGNLHRCNFQGDFRVLEELVTAAVARVAAGETVSTR